MAAIALGAAALAFGVSVTQADRYRASAELLFGRTTLAETLFARGVDETVVPERRAATNVALASLDTVAVRVKRRASGRASVDDLKAAVQVRSAGQSDLVTVTAEWSSSRHAGERLCR